MTDKPAYQVLQEEWNRLVAFGQAAGIPHLRPIKISPNIQYKARKEANAALREQLRVVVGEARFAAIMSGEAEAPPSTPASLPARQAGAPSPLKAEVEAVLRASDLASSSDDGLPPSPQEYRARRTSRDRGIRQTPGYIEPAILPAIDANERADITELGLIVTDDAGHFLVTDPVAHKYFAFRDASKRGHYRGGNLRVLLLAAKDIRATIPLEVK